MTLLPATFDATLGDTTYSIASRPVHLALFGAATAALLLVALVIAAWRRPGALIAPIVPALAAIVIAVPVYLMFSPARVRGERSVDNLFRDPLRYDAAAFAIGLGVLFASILILALRKEGHLRLVPIALPCAILGLSLTAAQNHAESLHRVGELPFFTASGPREMHVGHELDVPVQLARPAQRYWWFGWRTEREPHPVDDATRARWFGPDHVRVRATEAGKVWFNASAERGPVKMTTKLFVVGRREVASPLLSLRVGDRFVYRVRAKSSDGALLYFISISGHESIAQVSIDVTGTRERDGFRTFVLAIHKSGEVSEVEVVAVDGETHLYDVLSHKIGAPVIATQGDRVSLDPVPCSFALLGATDAICQLGGRTRDVPASITIDELARRRKTSRDVIARPPVAFAGAAPVTFQQNTSSGGGGFVTALVAVLTIGLVILPDGSSSSSYTLVSTERGPEGSPEARPEG